jgi:hypothetical protein
MSALRASDKKPPAAAVLRITGGEYILQVWPEGVVSRAAPGTKGQKGATMKKL